MFNLIMIEDYGYWRVSKPEICEFSTLSLKYKYLRVTPDIIIINVTTYNMVITPPA